MKQRIYAGVAWAAAILACGCGEADTRIDQNPEYDASDASSASGGSSGASGTSGTGGHAVEAGTGYGGTGGAGGTGGSRPPDARDYYVAESGSDLNTGTQGSPWKTIAKINGIKLAGGDIVHLSGTVADEFITDQKGSEAAPVIFQGDGTAVIKGILLTSAEHLQFVDLEAKGYVNSNKANCMPLVHIHGAAPVRHVTFTRIHLHDSDRGVLIGNHCKTTQPACPNDPGECCYPVGHDLTFEDTKIDSMSCDGVVFDDFAGDRISFIRGSITNTGLLDQHGVHGIYASGGHGHLVDHMTFQQNHNGWGVSLRRGDFVVRDSQFIGCADGVNGGINNNNEDEGTTGARALVYQIYRNLFVGNDGSNACTSIYQSTNNDLGIDDPRNTWAIFNNTFVNTRLNLSGKRPDTVSGAGTLTGGCLSDVYDIYLRNNVFVNGAVGVCAPVTHDGYSHIHQISNNAFHGISAQGSDAVMADPMLDSDNRVTNPALRDKGVAAIILNQLTMVANSPPSLEPLGYWGTKPDLGQTEQLP